MATKPKIEQPYSIDALMRKTARMLVRDFQEDLDDPLFCSEYSQILKVGTIQEIRQSCPTISYDDDTYRFKATYQISSLFKRHRFRKDIYSDQELIDLAIAGFVSTQDRIRNLNFDNPSCNLRFVLDYARMYIHRVLGVYDAEEHRSLCRFGRKASVGVPARKACEAARWAIPITGSRNQISWFRSEMDGIDVIQNYLNSQLDSDPKGSIYRETDSLTLTLVPKTFKSLRAIMPNTTIGSYMSYGLGEMIRKRLKRNGFDIKTLQMKHRVLARLASVHKRYVTADLSSASDSISVALVNRLFPSDWLQILHQSRIGKVVLPNGSTVQSETFCTMGVGYTFPLQTLVFLSLLIAIQALRIPRKDWQRISVYGDDLIYSRHIHDDVLQLFSELGFVINVDKTFVTTGFRESCGGDYFHGVDVRPFQPRNGSSFVLKREYEAILYKFINGILMRWSEYEVVHTLRYLTSEIEKCTGVCKLVPLDFPDDSGIKCDLSEPWDFLKATKVSRPKSLGHGIFRFTFLRLVPQYRKENRHEPYLWLALRGGNLPLHDYRMVPPDEPSFTQRLIEDACGTRVPTPLLTWREERDTSSVRSKLTGRRLRRLASFVVESHSGRYTRQSGVSTFGPRR